MNKGKVGIVGSGTIGRGWIILFARAGYQVSVFDEVETSISSAMEAIEQSMKDMEALGLMDDTGAALTRISIAGTLEDAAAGALYVQESVHEDRHIKEQVFLALDEHAPADAILASSCSAIPPEEFMAKVPGRERCIIAHPFSPPHAIPLVEVVKTQWNSPALVEKTCAMLEEIGQTPAIVNKPVYGFVINRMQAAVVNEAMHLVNEGVVSPRDLDRCMRLGLGLRWAFLGPFETMELNSPGGFMDYASKFGHAYQAMGEVLRVNEKWDPKTTAAIEEWRRSEYPVEAIAEKRAWRDRMLLKLQKLINSEREK